MACSNPAGDGDNGLTGIDAEDFGESASISRTFNVSIKIDWDNAITAIKNGGNNKNYVITLTNDVTIPGSDSYLFSTGVTGITVSLRGQKTLALDPSGAKGYLLSVTNKQALVLRESTLVGRNDNAESLVYIAGKFTMRSGKISGNIISSDETSGGGVLVSGTGASFTMSGGEIYGHSAPYGGGVLVYEGSFTMSDGKIYKNTASSNGYGGGVYVSNGNFTMSGGEIYENTVTSSGGGVFITDSSFIMSGGKIYGNNAAYFGGGVYVLNDRFTMSDGEISTNSAESGGGVYVYTGGRLNKTGGFIYGSDATDNSLKNTATTTVTTTTGDTISAGNAMTYLTGSADSTTAWHVNNTLSDTTDGNIDTADPKQNSVVLRQNGLLP
jgi:hypothetical protein